MSLTTELLGPSPDLAELGAGEHNDGGGLYLTVRESGAASWKFKFTLFGKATKMGLGSLSERSVEEARELAHKFRRLVRDGKDPRNERTAMGAPGNATDSTPTFKDFAHVILSNQVFKNPKSLACWKRTIDVHCKSLHDKPVHAITIDDVVAVLHPLYVNIPSVGREARQRLELIFDGAIARHPEAMVRNVATRALLKTLLPKLPKKGTVRGGHPSLHYALLPQFWCELRAINTIASRALQLLILTAARTNEVLQTAFTQIGKASADEFEKGALRWVIPGKVMKAAKRGEKGIDADIPLTPTALAIIEEMRAMLPEKETLVFPSQEQPGKYGVELGDRTLLALIQETMGYNGSSAEMPRVSTHGMRATFRSWGQNQRTHDRDVLEYILHHIEAGDAETSYLREDMWDKRWACLLDWEAFVTSKERELAGDTKLAA